ncbi:calcium-activated chloride channel regulator 1-like [Rhynchocyon petersi]
MDPSKWTPTDIYDFTEEVNEKISLIVSQKLIEHRTKMLFSLNITLFLVFQLLLGGKSSMVTLTSNGYEGIVIAINPNVPEDEKLIQSIKEMIIEASPYLFHATKQKVYFKKISILIPMTWKSKPDYLMSRQESYEQADVLIAAPAQKNRDDPYTLQYGQCGQKGQYIHFTPSFLLSDNLLAYGPRGRVFVHEWAHLRWGVFDEYNDDQPFYMSRKKTIEVTGIQTAKESIMFMQNFDSVVDFCTSKTHNRDAPNLQNKMCKQRSTWDVIKESDDFQNVSSIKATHPPKSPTFILLRSNPRVVCLVLDKSESMQIEDRFIRMKQAVEIFLIQILEKGSFAGLVTFSDVAEIHAYLTKISDNSAYQKITENLPKKATGGTAICDGLKEGFKAIQLSNRSTFGTEIILLTDGEDPTISSCFDMVKDSGAIIHTIALGPAAARELEKLAKMTGGYRFYANKDTTGLIDAFCRISSRSGNLSEQAVQLESKYFNISRNRWISGRVPMDSTVGSDTYFVVTWTRSKPEMFLQSPKGKIYTTPDFREGKMNIRSARLSIPGIAETGPWIYRLKNKDLNYQLLTVIVTTRASSLTNVPVTVTAHVSENSAQYPSPIIVYARVSQGFLPILGMYVTAIIEDESGHQVTLELWDSGAGADAVKNDGVYSRYFLDYHRNGRYSLKVRAQAKKTRLRKKLSHYNHKAIYVAGYNVNGTIVGKGNTTPSKDVKKPHKGAGIYRVTLGGTFIVSGVFATTKSNTSLVFPPSKINDLQAKFEKKIIQLTWTAPGNSLDKGNASRYDVRISKDWQKLQDDFDNAIFISTSNLIPKMVGSKEKFAFKPEIKMKKKHTKVYIAIKAINEANLTSEISNIAVATYVIPNPGANIFATSLLRPRAACSEALVHPSPHPAPPPSRKRQLRRRGWRRLPPPTTSTPAVLAPRHSPAAAPPPPS